MQQQAAGVEGTPRHDDVEALISNRRDMAKSSRCLTDNIFDAFVAAADGFAEDCINKFLPRRQCPEHTDMYAAAACCTPSLYPQRQRKLILGNSRLFKMIPAVDLAEINNSALPLLTISTSLLEQTLHNTVVVCMCRECRPVFVNVWRCSKWTLLQVWCVVVLFSHCTVISGETTCSSRYVAAYL